VQDKFRLDLSDEEAVQYLQALIDESVNAIMASLAEHIHKWAQVGLRSKFSRWEITLFLLEEVLVFFFS